MSKPIEIDLTNQGDRAPAFGTALSSADADQAASRLAPDGLQSTGARFTPGDWHADGRGAKEGRGGHEDEIVVYSDRGRDICFIPEDDEQDQANANMCSAAPQLFEALSLYVAACGNTAASVDRELVQEAWRRASAALAKAQGK